MLQKPHSVKLIGIKLFGNLISMPKKINIEKLFTALDEEMRLKLSSKIDEIHHPTAKGVESEYNWIGLLRLYLPERYKVDSGFIVDYKGNISDQIDIIIYDRHFTPFIFRGENTLYIPAEGVYAVFEVKQYFSKAHFDYAVEKLRSVNALKRTSAKFAHISGTSKKDLFDIVGGILSQGNMSKVFFNKLDVDSKLSFIVSLESGGIKVFRDGIVEERTDSPILAFFLLKLIERLQLLGSAPALDVNLYLN